MKAIRPKQDVDLPKDTRLPVHTVVEDSLWDAWLAALKLELNKPLDEVAEIEHDIDCAHLDGGGMIREGEPTVEATIDGCKFTCYARQVEFLTPGLRIVSDKLIGEHVHVNGRWWRFVLTKETAEKIATAFEEQAKKKQGEVNRVWGDLDDARKSAKIVAPSRSQVKDRHNAAYRRAKFRDN